MSIACPSNKEEEVFVSKTRSALTFLAVSVMIEEPPTSFSPFSLVDCTMLTYFSFNDFVAVAFPDLARDLDIQI